MGSEMCIRDRDYTVLPFAGGAHYPMALNVVWCLVDFDGRNGATLVWPGSHLSCAVPDAELAPDAAVRVDAPAGSAVVWDAALWHQGGINRGTEPRWTVIGYYLRPWLRGKTDSIRMLPPAAVARMSAARRLVGIMPAVSDYSEVKALSPEQLAALSLEQRKVLGFPVY